MAAKSRRVRPSSSTNPDKRNQSGGGGSPDLSDIKSQTPNAASAIHSTAAQMPSASDNCPIKINISMATVNTALPSQKLRLPVFN